MTGMLKDLQMYLQGKTYQLITQTQKPLSLLAKTEMKYGGEHLFAMSIKLYHKKNPNEILYVENGKSPHYYYRGREMYFLKDKFHKCFTENGIVDAMSNLLGDIWLDINTGKLFNEGTVDFRNGKKPEFLIARILDMTTSPADLVLDSFLGSGTTAAVALKMGRRFIGIELGEHAYTHCHTRLKAVVDGEQGGISKAVNWQGGGGFKFYELAPTLLTTSKHGNLIISDKYNDEMLAQAMAKHEGYTYAPDADIFWKQGFSGESNFIFTITGYISIAYLDNIASGLSEGEYLLICAESCDSACVKRHNNIIVRPIPKMLLGRCEWGRDSYDLNILLANSDDWEGINNEE